MASPLAEEHRALLNKQVKNDADSVRRLKLSKKRSNRRKKIGAKLEELASPLLRTVQREDRTLQRTTRSLTSLEMMTMSAEECVHANGLQLKRAEDDFGYTMTVSTTHPSYAHSLYFHCLVDNNGKLMCSSITGPLMTRHGPYTFANVDEQQDFLDAYIERVHRFYDEDPGRFWDDLK